MRLARVLPALIVASGVASCVFAPAAIERAAQGVAPGLTGPLSDRAVTLHSRLTIVDWHADSLLWKRDLLEPGTRGHVDVPRLQQGNVAVQMFTAPTKTPVGTNYESNEATFDMTTMLALIQLWPVATWNSRFERALHMARKLERFALRSGGALQIVVDREGLEEVLRLRARGETVVAGMLGIEGAHALDGDLENIERLEAAGFRMVGLQHFFDNGLGGSLHGVEKGGLTDFGRKVVARLEARKMIVDLAHSSPAVVNDVLAIAKRPVMVSHTGVYGACPTARNLQDEQMQRLARAGGLIAIGYWDGAVCDITPQGVARSLRYAVDLLGVDHVALGSDYDGGTTTAFDAAGLGALTQALLDTGFTLEEIEKVMGGNSLRFLRANLPVRAEAIAAR